MGALDIKRCATCAGPLSAVPVDQWELPAGGGPLVVCRRCDNAPAELHTLLSAAYVPRDWES
jgi:hypothetical protein